MSDKIRNIVVSVVFIGFICAVFLINVFKSDTLISTSERRKLATFPKITIKGLFDNSVINNFEKYTMDQFPKRETFRKIKTLFEMKIFNKKDLNNVYLKDGYLIKQEFPLSEKSVMNVSNKINNIIDTYLSDKNKVYYSIIPDKNYFINEGNLRIDYDKLVSIMNDNVKATYIDIFNELKLTDYYYTDTHWKQENLGNVVNKIADEMNFDKIDISSLEKKKVTKFYGVLSGQLKLNAKDDYIYVLSNEAIENAIVTNYETNEVTSVYNYDKLEGFDKYDIYLSGATPLLYIENKMNKSGRELVIFRDSYGSSIIPLMIPAYSKITVVDIRYISSKYLTDLVNFKAQDILFLYSALVINNSSTLK